MHCIRVADGFSSQHWYRVVARLTFAHATAGKWELVLLSQADAKLAMGAFRRVLGYENVEVTLKLKGKPG